MCWRGRRPIPPRSCAGSSLRLPARCAGASRSPIWRGRASARSTRSVPARCCPAWSSASRTARPECRSARQRTLRRSRPRAGEPKETAMFDLTGKTALVTGATGGIGGAIARALHHQGTTVAISGTRREALALLAGELGGRVHELPCDLADKDAVEALVPKAEAVMGKLDILVANAGITRDNLLVQLSDQAWDEVIAVNLTATFRLARAAVKTMMRRRHGRIIGITSVVGVTGNPGQANYTAAKAGMIGMIKSIGAEYAK